MAKARTKARTKTSKVSPRSGGRRPARPKAAAPQPRKPVENDTGYSTGAFVVHPKYGVGRIEGVQEHPVGESELPCLEIVFPAQEMKLAIPVDQVEHAGMRKPIARRELNQVFKVLRGRASVSQERRSAKRVLDYRKRLSQGDPTSLAEAVRDLGRLSRRKPLSYEERRILGTALRILSREVALARGREPEKVREEIENIVYR